METITTNPFPLRQTVSHFTAGLNEVIGVDETVRFSRSMHERKFTHGSQETQGILIMAGRAGFNYWLKNNYEAVGWDSAEFRFQPVKKKIATGLERLCTRLEEETGSKINFTNEEKKWKISIYPGTVIDQHSYEFPCGYLWGFVQEFCRWAGLGKFYAVNEICCTKENCDHCELIILKESID
jgi:hypothetical protein